MEKHTHQISKQVDVVFLDPVAEDLCCCVSFSEDELYEPGCLLLGRRLILKTAVLLSSCRKGQKILVKLHKFKNYHSNDYWDGHFDKFEQMYMYRTYLFNNHSHLIIKNCL